MSTESSEKQIDPRENAQEQETLFLSMLESHQDAIFRFIYFRVGNRAVALDITQDTFSKVWVYMASGKKIEYPEAFLYRSARNAIIDYYKKEKSLSLDSLMDDGYDPSSTKDVDDIMKGDDIASIRSLVEDLDEESRQIIFLRFTEEKPIEEIAQLFGKTANAMTVRIHRIVKRLKDQYELHHGE